MAVDFPDAETSGGIVRLAPKVLPSSTSELARSATYGFAAYGLRVSGASAGINAKPEKRGEAMERFLVECAPLVSSGAFLPEPGKGVWAEDLEPLAADDPRHPIRLKQVDGLAVPDILLGQAAATAMDAAAGLNNRRVTIEGGGGAGIAAAEEADRRGASLVAFATPEGTCAESRGLDVSAVREAWAAHGDAFPHHLPGSPKSVLEVETDVLFLGSKIGALDHGKAAGLNLKAVASLHPIPFTTRALVTLQAAGAVVLPDFVFLGSRHFASWPSDLASLAGDAATLERLTAAAMERIASIVNEALPHPDGAFLAACYLAEDFLRTWREELPFGRPLAP